MLIPTKETSAKIIESKSSFTAHVFPIDSEDEVAPILERIKKKHKSAANIPYAYRILKFVDGKKQSFERYSDDGEPSRTAGYPILRMFHNKNLSNLLVVVARVYGGVNLGMAGLMKAFTEAAQTALNNNKLIEKELKEEIIIETNLQEYHNIELILRKYKVEFEHEFLQDKVILKCYIPLDEEKNKMLKNHIKQFLAP
jgi:uncharacterized YigZ family protein